MASTFLGDALTPVSSRQYSMELCRNKYLLCFKRRLYMHSFAIDEIPLLGLPDALCLLFSTFVTNL